MNNPKLNQSDVETSTTKPIIETQCTSCSKYPLKNYTIVFKERDILKKFEKSGWKYTRKPNNKILFEKYNQDYALNDFILINMNLKIYSGTFIDLKTHQLLTKLFESLEEMKDEI